MFAGESPELPVCAICTSGRHAASLWSVGRLSGAGPVAAVGAPGLIDASRKVGAWPGARPAVSSPAVSGSFSLFADLEGQVHGTRGCCRDPTGWTSDVTCLILRLTPGDRKEPK
jgi:hypothetical protein